MTLGAGLNMKSKAGHGVPKKQALARTKKSGETILARLLDERTVKVKRDGRSLAARMIADLERDLGLHPNEEKKQPK